METRRDSAIESQKNSLKDNENTVQGANGNNAKADKAKENSSDVEILEEEEIAAEEEEEAEEETVEEAVEEQEFSIKATARPHKYPFRLKQNDNGNILTVHHTVREADKVIRIRLGVCCFSDYSTQFVAIDKRGNVFVFDMAIKRYWRLTQLVLKACVIKPFMHKSNEYLVGTKLGQLLLLDVEKSHIKKALDVCSSAITEISFPGQPLQPSHLVFLHVVHEAILVNLDTFTATHRLDFDKVKISLKFACYLPYSDQIFTCFTNDAVHVWSGVTLNTTRVVHPIKMRDRKLRLVSKDTIQEFSLYPKHNEFQLDCHEQDYANGLIIAYCNQPEGGILCLSTLDNYLLLLSTYTFELQSIFRLREFILKQCIFMTKPKQALILGLTTVGQVVLLDYENTEFKMIVQSSNASYMSIACDGKLLAVTSYTGEADVWSTCHLYNTLKSQEQCMQMLKAAFKQSKPVTLAATADATGAANECIQEDIRKLLKRERLFSIVREYGCYPAKYRKLIWCTLLKLPYNRIQFQQLLKMGVPAEVKQRAQKLKLKDESLKRALIKVWSCLAHWCKVFAYSEFVPSMIFPFVKMFPKNSLVAFELCATLVLNHFQLWFEFHPMEPANYLGMCENLLQSADPELCKFYASLHIEPIHYAWPLLSTAFSEVLDEEQWMCLWDNIFSCPIYFPIFCCVAYNILQREVLLRLPNKKIIVHFFRDQNPIDVCKVVSKAACLMKKCPSTLHPNRYLKNLQYIPNNVYPKFLSYPQEWIAKHEVEVAALQKENRAIDARIRQLELEEYKMQERLEDGLKAEEHTKRMKEMEKLYQDTLKREEDRLACQRKMLLLYQKEIRSRKGEIIVTLQESERRKKALEMEKELDSLRHSIERERVRNDTNMVLAEDEIRNQDMELYAQKCFVNTQKKPLALTYYDDIRRLCNERKLLNNNLKEISTRPSSHRSSLEQTPTRLDDIEKQINEIHGEFMNLCANRE